MKKFQICIAGVIGLLSSLALAATAYLAFIFPKTVAIWAEEERALSLAQRLMLSLSDVATSAGLLIIPVLLFIVIACIVLAILAGRRGK